MCLAKGQRYWKLSGISLLQIGLKEFLKRRPISFMIREFVPEGSGTMISTGLWQVVYLLLEFNSFIDWFPTLFLISGRGNKHRVSYIFGAGFNVILRLSETGKIFSWR